MCGRYTITDMTPGTQVTGTRDCFRVCVCVCVGTFVCKFLCAEMEGAVQRKNWEELRECVKKIENTCVGDMVQQQPWFRKGKELLWKRELGEKAMIEAMRSNDEVDGDRPSDHVINVIVAAFIMVGVSEEEVDVSTRYK